jgi:hypothetical protein
MLELRRGLYMDERGGGRSAGFDETRLLVRSLLETTARWLSE